MGVQTPPATTRETRDSVVIRFAGDSGDGMQVTGAQFTVETALAGNDLSTFPDFPAEIRAPAGTTFGVSAYQIHFGSNEILTPGDDIDVLVAMNPAALQVNIKDLKPGGLVLVDTGAFSERNLQKAGFTTSPLEGDFLAQYSVLKLDVTQRTLEAVKEFGLGNKDALRSRNMWALGLMLWMYGRDKQATVESLTRRFAKKPDAAKSAVAALNAGHAYGETAELGAITSYVVPRAAYEPGLYRTINGADAIVFGLVVGCRKAGLERLAFSGYPITPASSILQALANLKSYGVVTFQAEDEIAAVCAAIGSSYAGALGVTASSGPGIALKTEAIGLAIATELPLVVVNVQRAGPSTGLPTKTEQSDLYQAVIGRNADAPMPVLAAATPADGFDVAVEAVRLATRYMTPVMVLSDGFLANASEPWIIPDVDAIPAFPVRFHTDPEGFQPFLRDPDTLARVWALPGTPGLEHRIGGIERSYDTGHISYDPDNHAKMTVTRAAKVAGIANDIPEQTVSVGPVRGKLAVVGWGSTFGAIHQGVKRCREEGLDVAQIHIRYLAPFPRNLGDLLKGYERVIVPEMNNGQLVNLLRAKYLVPAEPLTKVNGKPFKSAEIAAAIRTTLENT